MMQHENWYFDNITEDIIQGDIYDGGSWIAMCRRLKKDATIRKYGNDKRIKTTNMPPILAEAIEQYRNEKRNQGV